MSHRPSKPLVDGFSDLLFGSMQSLKLSDLMNDTLSALRRCSETLNGHTVAERGRLKVWIETLLHRVQLLRSEYGASVEHFEQPEAWIQALQLSLHALRLSLCDVQAHLERDRACGYGWAAIERDFPAFKSLMQLFDDWLAGFMRDVRE